MCHNWLIQESNDTDANAIDDFNNIYNINTVPKLFWPAKLQKITKKYTLSNLW